MLYVYVLNSSQVASSSPRNRQFCPGFWRCCRHSLHQWETRTDGGWPITSPELMQLRKLKVSVIVKLSKKTSHWDFTNYDKWIWNWKFRKKCQTRSEVRSENWGLAILTVCIAAEIICVMWQCRLLSPINNSIKPPCSHYIRSDCRHSCEYLLFNETSQ